MGRRLPVPACALLVALAVLGAACGSDAPPTTSGPANSPSGSPAATGSIGELTQGAPQLSLLIAQSVVLTGKGDITFGLVTGGGDLVTGGTAQLYAAPDQTSPALGPFPGTFHQYTAFQEFPSDSPISPLTGFYVAEVELPNAGNWVFAGVPDGGPQQGVGTAILPATEGPIPAQVGTKALSVETPVGTTDAELRAISTRDPPDPMHYLSLDKALANGKPTVVNFGTPLLCESRMCGPVVDEVIKVYTDIGKDQANFVQVEIYPERDVNKPAPPFLAYGFNTEPITLVIDRDGVIQARWEGPVTYQQIEAALQPLL
jgi:hypothetical protein